MPSIAARFYKFALRTFQQPEPNSSPQQMVAWFRSMNVHNPSRAHVHLCKLAEEQQQGLRYHYIIPKKVTSNTLLVYLHGGSYVGGPHLLQWSLLGRIASQAGCKAVMLHYRLAPEHPFPASLEDTLRFYDLLQQENPSAEIIFMGDSAGAGLALAASLQLKDQQKKQPSKLVLLSPWLDVRLQNPAIDAVEAHEVMLMRKGVQQLGQLYAGKTSLTHPYVSPLYGNLHGLPPVLLAIGTHDIFYPDTRLFQQKAQQAGIDLTYLQEEGLFHDWAMFPFLSESTTAIKHIVDFIQPAAKKAAAI